MFPLSRQKLSSLYGADQGACAFLIGVGFITNDFYEFPVIVAIVIASIVAVMMNRKLSLQAKIEEFCKGADHSNVILMVLIFLLAGAFSEVAKGMGAVESTVHLTIANY